MDLGTVVNNHSDSMDVQQETTTAAAFLPYGSHFARLVSDDILALVEEVLDLGINSVLAYLGIVNNILTIIVFAKMGYRETSNISMTAIAIWDLFKCIIHAIYHLYGPLRLVSFAVGMSLAHISLVLLHIANIATYASCVLAAYVAIERCLCVSMPFIVKSLLTRKSVTITCVSISGLVTCSYVIFFSTVDYVEVTSMMTNETYIQFRESDFGIEHNVINDYIFIISQLYPVATLCITSVCTVIIVYHLKKSSRFRSETQKDGSSQLSSRDRQIVKMLVVVIIIYIVCSIPWVTMYLAISVYSDFQIESRYNNLFWLCFYIVFFFTLTDASVNIYIFFFMSSHFKQTLKELLHLSVETKKTNVKKITTKLADDDKINKG